MTMINDEKSRKPLLPFYFLTNKAYLIAWTPRKKQRDKRQNQRN
jgi:hypothetical protein